MRQDQIVIVFFSLHSLPGSFLRWGWSRDSYKSCKIFPWQIGCGYSFMLNMCYIFRCMKIAMHCPKSGGQSYCFRVEFMWFLFVKQWWCVLCPVSKDLSENCMQVLSSVGFFSLMFGKLFQQLGIILQWDLFCSCGFFGAKVQF